MAEADHMRYLRPVALADVAAVEDKERTYRGSWKRRGGVGAFIMLARKWDRLESILSNQDHSYDIFNAISLDKSGDDGTVLAEVRDLRRYLLLVEAEMVARGMEDNREKIDPWLNISSRAFDKVSQMNNDSGVPGHAVSDPAPVPLEDSNRHADRAPPTEAARELSHWEWNQLPREQQRDYEWSPSRKAYVWVTGSAS